MYSSCVRIKKAFFFSSKFIYIIPIYDVRRAATEWKGIAAHKHFLSCGNIFFFSSFIFLLHKKKSKEREKGGKATTLNGSLGLLMMIVFKPLAQMPQRERERCVWCSRMHRKLYCVRDKTKRGCAADELDAAKGERASPCVPREENARKRSTHRHN